MAREEPKKFGRCVVKAKLGEGAMGDIYLAEHMTLQIPVAVKVPRRNAIEDPHYISRFMREARIAARLHHPNIVRVYDCGEEDGYYYLVMDYVQGRTCREEIDRSERFDWREATRIVLTVADGLRYAAKEGMIHRDVKPENIMIDAQGKPLIMDLGLARYEALEASHLTQTEDMLGTPFYVSPEQIRSPHDVDFRTDIYSLGATFYHMVCGEVPFPGGGIYEIMNKHLREPVPSPRETVPDMPQALCDVILKMMAKNPRDRYAAYDDLIEDLQRIHRGEQVSAAAPAEAEVADVEEAEAPQRGAAPRPGRLPAPAVGAVHGICALLSLLAIAGAATLLFHGLGREGLLPVAVLFALAAAGGEVVCVRSLLRLRRRAGLVGPDAGDDLHKRMFSLLKGLAEWLELPMPRLHVSAEGRRGVESYALSRNSLVLDVSQGFLDSVRPTDAENEAILARQLARFYYGHSMFLTVLNGPLVLFSAVAKPAEALCRMATGVLKPPKHAAALALAIGWLVLVCALVALAGYLWLWGGLALAVFLVGGLLGLSVRRGGEYAADLFAAAVLGDTGPVKTLVAKEALLRPGEVRVMLRGAGVEEPPPAGQPEEGPEAGESPDGETPARLARRFSRERWSGELAGRIQIALTGRPAPVRRINALAGIVPRLGPLHGLIGRALTALGRMIGARDGRRQSFLAEPDRIRPHVLAGSAGGVLTAVSTLILLHMGAGSYLSFLAVLALVAGVLGWIVGRVFMRQGGARHELAWSLVTTVTSLSVAQMFVFALAGGSQFGGKVFMPPVLLPAAFAVACVCAALAIRLRRRRGRSAAPSPRKASSQQ